MDVSWVLKCIGMKCDSVKNVVTWKKGDKCPLSVNASVGDVVVLLANLPHRVRGIDTSFGQEKHSRMQMLCSRLRFSPINQIMAIFMSGTHTNFGIIRTNIIQQSLRYLSVRFYILWPRICYFERIPWYSKWSTGKADPFMFRRGSLHYRMGNIEVSTRLWLYSWVGFSVYTNTNFTNIRTNIIKQSQRYLKVRYYILWPRICYFERTLWHSKWSKGKAFRSMFRRGPFYYWMGNIEVSTTIWQNSWVGVSVDTHTNFDIIRTNINQKSPRYLSVRYYIVCPRICYFERIPWYSKWS